jgi:hypothetical protein
VTALIQDRLRCEKYVDPQILRRWYGSGEAESSAGYLGLWRVLSLEMWMRAFKI